MIRKTVIISMEFSCEDSYAEALEKEIEELINYQPSIVKLEEGFANVEITHHEIVTIVNESEEEE